MRNILCQSRSEVKMAGESAHSRPESSSSAEEREERELPHVREGWEEREGEREQEEGEGESRREGRFGYFLSFCVSVPCGFFANRYQGIMLRVHSDGLMFNHVNGKCQLSISSFIIHSNGKQIGSI